MATLDLSHGNVGGMQLQELPARPVVFMVDFAEVYAKYPAYVATDLIKIGTLKKGMLLLGAMAEIVEKSLTASVSTVGVETGAATAVIDAIAPDAAVGTVTAAGTTTGKYFDVAAPVKFLTADVDVMINPGTTVPTSGKIEVRFAAFQLANFNL